MSDDTRRILDLLAQGKITVDEAHRLIAALGGSAAPADTAAGQSSGAAGQSSGAASQSSGAASQSSGAASQSSGSEKDKPRYIKIAVHKPANDHRGEEDVKIRVPISVMRGGMRLGAIIPGWGGERLRARLREQGIDLDLSKLDPAAFETMLNDLGEMNIDIDSGKAQVRITCE